ncbi:TPA: hypothetical protein EYN98_26580 [Candidatus Poribacteria bacterium]|nr:hypothetical protein [Candidatus Poribacteria bacterium]
MNLFQKLDIVLGFGMSFLTRISLANEGQGSSIKGNEIVATRPLNPTLLQSTASRIEPTMEIINNRIATGK